MVPLLPAALGQCLRVPRGGRERPHPAQGALAGEEAQAPLVPGEGASQSCNPASPGNCTEGPPSPADPTAADAALTECSGLMSLGHSPPGWGVLWVHRCDFTHRRISLIREGVTLFPSTSVGHMLC